MSKVAIAVSDSSNGKLGRVAATYVSQGSCPLDCPFRGSGCYAEVGFTGITTRRLNRADDGLSPLEIARAEAGEVDKLPGNKPMRGHVVGDSRTNASARVVGASYDRYSDRGYARFGVRPEVWLYSHAWRRVDRASWGRHSSVLASVETAAGYHAARARGYACAIVVDQFRSERAYDSGEGFKILPCPAQTRGVTCDQCRLCWDDDRLYERNMAIGFSAHSQRASSVRTALEVLNV